MPTIEYSLFRVKFVRPRQLSIFHDDLTAQDLLLMSVHDKPSAEAKKGYRWHIGNLRQFSDTNGYFAVGRTKMSTIGQFNHQLGDFVEEEREESPFTHCVFDAAIGLVGIAKKPSLAQTTGGIASRLEQLLGSTDVVQRNSVTVEVRPIPDPDGFLQALDSAYQVSTFSATFRGPNPFDADEYFQKPLSVYLSAANGMRGKATITGDDLNREVLQEVTRSTAATGNEASARIRRTRGEKPITVNLLGDPIKRTYDEDEHRPEQVLEDLLSAYRRVRHEEN